MTGVLMKGGDLNADTHTESTSCEHEGRDQVMCLQAKEHQGLPINLHELGKRHGVDSSSEGTNPADTLISNGVFDSHAAKAVFLPTLRYLYKTHQKSRNQTLFPSLPTGHSLLSISIIITLLLFTIELLYNSF